MNNQNIEVIFAYWVACLIASGVIGKVVKDDWKESVLFFLMASIFPVSFPAGFVACVIGRRKQREREAERLAFHARMSRIVEVHKEILRFRGQQ